MPTAETNSRAHSRSGIDRITLLKLRRMPRSTGFGLPNRVDHRANGSESSDPGDGAEHGQLKRLDERCS